MASCASKEKQLGAVARDWCMTIRASQVIPVYPMTEDLQPGDVFLVQRTVDDQHKAYSKQGFLPLENHLIRLNPTGYANSYLQSFYREADGVPVMPRFWLSPGEETSFGTAPGAAFPAYTFAVSNGQGFSAALPIQGVPVGMSLMNSNSATGSVTIKDAHTYGLAIMTMLPDVQSWAAQPETRQMLALYAAEPSAAGVSNYIRVVSRVYLTGKLNVTLNDTSASSGGLSVGVPKPVELPLLAAPVNTDGVVGANADSYKKGLDSMNDSLAASLVKNATGQILPGATLKIVASSARSVSIDETFKRPVVIGYLGFDMAILPGGGLGPPCPTHAVLERTMRPIDDQQLPDLATAQLARNISTYRAITAIAGSDSDPSKARAEVIRAEMERIAAQALPPKYPMNTWNLRSDGSVAYGFAKGDSINTDAGSYRALVSYVDALQASTGILDQERGKQSLTPEQAGDLATARAELTRIEATLVGLDAQLRRANSLLDK
jgi:hypothetical protein